MKATSKDDTTLQEMSGFLTYFDKCMAEMAMVSDMMMTFIKTPERYCQVVTYCMIHHFVLHHLQMFRDGRRIYMEYRSLL